MSSKVLFVACCAVFALPALAQTASLGPGQDSIHVKVTDVSGASIGKAQVRVTAIPILLDTDADGMATFTLPSFQFNVQVQSPGFSPQSRVVNGSDVKPKPFQLRVGSCPPDCPLFPHLALYLYKSPLPQGEKILSYDPSEFAHLPHQSVSVTNGHTHVKEVYSGVPLSKLLPLIGAPTGDGIRGVALSQYLLLTGEDGYRVVVPLAETDPAFYPGMIMVADTLNGKGLGEKEGPFKLVVSQDQRPARWVRNLKSIELKQVE